MSSSRVELAEAPPTHPRDSATETAQLIADLVSDRAAFPDAAVGHLAELLGHSLAAGSIGERRQARLGLLIDLVSCGTGEFITSSTYEDARADRKASGEEWPTASALSRAYGHWLAALRAACRYWFDGGRSRVSSSYAHTGRQQKYQPQEIHSALLQAQLELGFCAAQANPDRAETGDRRVSAAATWQQWPTEWEYLEWARIKRRLARRAGIACRLPERGAIRAAYGTYATAIEAVRRGSR